MVSEKMLEALRLAKSQPDNCISKYQLHPRTAYALLARALLKRTSGYGWQHGGIYELTEKGKQALKEEKPNGNQS